jgi:hypothetical protein
MNAVALKKVFIMHELSRVPEGRLDNVLAYIETLIGDVSGPQSKNVSLKGIWKDTGLGEINIDGELHTARQELQHLIFERKF